MTDDRIMWHEAHPPRSLTLANLTGLTRVLGNRPRGRVLQPVPVVAFETWSFGGSVRWLIGSEANASGNLPWLLCSQLPGLRLVRLPEVNRPLLTLAADVRLSSASFPLRTDVAESVSAGVLAALGKLRTGEAACLQWVVGSSHQRATRPTDFDLKTALGLQPVTRPDAVARQSWKLKASEPLYGVRCRIGAQAATPERAAAIIRSVVDALSLAESPHCHLKVSRATEWRARGLAGVHRPGSVWSSILNAAELGGMLAWPLGDVTVPGRTVALPPAPRTVLVAEDDLQLSRRRILGVGHHPADGGQLVQMPPATSRHGFHVVGPTGSGKSELLARLILSDAEAGHTVLCLEPRGDLVHDVLGRLPAHRHEDVVVIDPGDLDQVGFNPLAGPAVEAERKADGLLNLFREVFGSSIGPRSGDVLLHVLLTAARMQDGTLADVVPLLTSPAFARRALAVVGDPLVLTPWWGWYFGLSNAESGQVVAPVLNKLRAFLSRQPIRRMLGNPRPAFSLDEAFMTRPRVVLVNTNRGVAGAEASRLIGALLLQSAWAAMQRRATLPPGDRFPVSWYVDEFADYVGALDFGQVLAQARGLGGQITVAHQDLSQLSPKLRAAVAANARSRLAFHPSPDDAKPLAAMFGNAVTADDLLALGAFQAAARLYVGGEMADPFGVKTLPLGPVGHDVADIRRQSRKRYATDGAALDEYLRERWHGGGREADGPVGVRQRRRP